MHVISYHNYILDIDSISHPYFLTIPNIYPELDLHPHPLYSIAHPQVTVPIRSHGPQMGNVPIKNIYPVPSLNSSLALVFSTGSAEY